MINRMSVIPKADRLFRVDQRRPPSVPDRLVSDFPQCGRTPCVLCSMNAARSGCSYARGRIASTTGGGDTECQRTQLFDLHQVSPTSATLGCHAFDLNTQLTVIKSPVRYSEPTTVLQEGRGILGRCAGSDWSCCRGRAIRAPLMDCLYPASLGQHMHVSSGKSIAVCSRTS